MTCIEDSGVAPLAAIWSANGTEPTAVTRSSSANAANPFDSPSRPCNVVVVSLLTVVRWTDIWLNGGPMLFRRLVASSGDVNECEIVSVRPPSAVAVGPWSSHPAATTSSSASSLASVGTAATTAASAVATTVIVPVPSSAIDRSTSTST